MDFRKLLLFLLGGIFLFISCYKNTNQDNESIRIIESLKQVINNSRDIPASEKVLILTEAMNHFLVNQNDSMYLQVVDQFLIFYKDSPSRKIEFCLKGIAVAEKINDNNKLLKYFDMARSGYLRIKEYPFALKYATKHLALTKQIGTKKELLLSINNLGIHYNAKENFDSAMVYYNLMNSLNVKPIDSTIQNVYWINSAIIYGKNSNYDKAIETFSKALKFNDGYRDKLAYVQNQMATLYISKGDYEKALEIAKKAEINAQDLNNSLKISIDKSLFEIYEKKKKLKYENLYFQRFIKAQMHEDSIRIERSNELLDLDYKAQKQELSLLDLNQKIEKETYNNKLLIIIIVSAGILLFLFGFFISNLTKSKNKIKVQNLEIEQLNQNLEVKVNKRTEELSEANKELIKKNFEITEALFKGQTIERKRVAAELHDNLGSTLSAIKWRLGALDSESLNAKEKEIYQGIKSMMNNAYEDVRNISHNLMPAEFESRGLVGALEKIVSEINENGRIKFELKTEGDLDLLKKNIALELYSISMELITNILKHSEARNSWILLRILDKELKLEICDNGIGFNENLGNSGKGLSQIKQRVRNINGKLTITKDFEWNTKWLIEVYDF